MIISPPPREYSYRALSPNGIDATRPLVPAVYVALGFIPDRGSSRKILFTGVQALSVLGSRTGG